MSKSNLQQLLTILIMVTFISCNSNTPEKQKNWNHDFVATYINDPDMYDSISTDTIDYYTLLSYDEELWYSDYEFSNLHSRTAVLLGLDNNEHHETTYYIDEAKGFLKIDRYHSKLLEKKK
jgi:hypothetical protein